MGGSILIIAFRVFARCVRGWRVAKRGLAAAWHWLVSDWRNPLLALCLGALIWHTARVDPRLRHERDDARAERDAAETTIANLRLAGRQAETRQAQNLTRVSTEQKAITERTVDAYQARLAELRARAADLASRLQGAPAATHSRLSGDADLPGAGHAPGRAAASAADHRLPDAAGADAAPKMTVQAMSLDERLIASEQAEQLNALIDWVLAQAAVQTSPDLPLPKERP